MESLSNNIKAILALIIVVGCIGYLFMVTLLHQQDSNVLSQAIIAIVGVLGTATGYYFGYSQGASKKDDIIANQSTPSTVQNAETVQIDQSKK